MHSTHYLYGWRALLIVLAVVAAPLWLAGGAPRFALALLLLLFAPGYLAERALRQEWPAPALVRPALWLGLSLSIVPLLYLWATTLRLPLTAGALTALAAACALALFVLLWRRPPLARLPGRNERLPLLACGLVLLVTFLLRFANIAGLALPLWVDSVHHALLVRVAVETGFVPLDLRPYLPIAELPYHWGYHVLVAASVLLGNAPIPQAMLWAGQALNALHALTAAALALALWRSPLAALLAAVAVGLVSLMPAYYVTWGRYTQLTGLLVLPPLVVAWLQALRRPSWRALLLAALLGAGLALVHYRVLVFGAPLLALLWAGRPQTAGAEVHQGGQWLAVGGRERSEHGGLRSAVASAASRLRSVIGGLWPMIALGLLATLLTAPWLLLLARRVLLPAVEAPGGLVGGEGPNTLSAGLLWVGQNALLFALAGLGALGALWRRHSMGLALLGWLAAMVLMANPQVVRLPPVWLLTNDALAIMLFLPAGLLIGALALPLEAWGRFLRPPRRAWYCASLVVATLAWGAWGAWGLRSVVNPRTVLADAADVRAIAWAAANTPPDARFFVSSVGWLPGVARGGDAGSWLLPLVGRWTTVAPPIFVYGPPDYVRDTLALQREVVALPTSEPRALLAWLRARSIGYVYVGAHNSPLAADALRAEPGFEQLYSEGGATIFRVASAR
jgi:hypothetical protein